MAQADEYGRVQSQYHLVFTGLDHEGNPNYYAVEGTYWKPGGKDANPSGLPDGWLVLDSSAVVYLTVPEGFNPLAAAVAGIDEEIQSVRAKAELAIQDLIHKKNELLMLGHNGGSVRELTVEEAGQAGEPHADIPF